MGASCLLFPKEEVPPSLGQLPSETARQEPARQRPQISYHLILEVTSHHFCAFYLLEAGP